LKSQHRLATPLTRGLTQSGAGGTTHGNAMRPTQNSHHQGRDGQRTLHEVIVEIPSVSFSTMRMTRCFQLPPSIWLNDF
jgi:hypothetical protein